MHRQLYGASRTIRGLLYALSLAVALTLSPISGARAAEAEMVTQTVTLVDETRPVKASMGFAGSPERRIDVMIWRPEGQKRPLPLIIYSHGTFGHANNAMHLVKALVDAGYVVAAPEYPLTSRRAYTRITFADVSDLSEQVRDLGFIITSLTGDANLGKLIDPARIGTTGHSLGAVTSYFGSFSARLRDPRIKATAPIAAGDPVQSALDTPMGMAGAGYWPGSVPVLFLSAEHDVFTALTGPPHVALSRVAPPKHEVMVKGGVHVWFTDPREQAGPGKNPDCLFFEEHLPQMTLPMCQMRYSLIDPQRQRAIARTALVVFFDAYLKGDKAGRAKLGAISATFPEAELKSSD